MHNRLDRAPRPLSIAAISAASLLALTTTARAQSAEAEALFSDGDALMKQGKIAQACEAFEASNRIEARAGTLIRLGECRERNHQLASAWSAYKDALTRVKDPKKKAIATAKVAELEPKLSYLTVSVPDESRVDGLALTRNGQPLDPALWNRAVPVNGGEYVIGGRAPGHEEWKTTATVADERAKVSVDVPKFKEIAKLVIPPAPDQPPGRRTQRPESPGGAAQRPQPSIEQVDDGRAESPMWTVRRKIAIGAASGTTLGLIVGIVLGVQANGKQNDAHALCPDTQTPCADAARADALNQTARSRALGANISFGIAGVGAIAAGVLWFTGAPESPAHHVALVPSIAPGETTIAVVGRF
jgi:hypothetical protein